MHLTQYLLKCHKEGDDINTGRLSLVDTASQIVIYTYRSSGQLKARHSVQRGSRYCQMPWCHCTRELVTSGSPATNSSPTSTPNPMPAGVDRPG